MDAHDLIRYLENPKENEFLAILKKELRKVCVTYIIPVFQAAFI